MSESDDLHEPHWLELYWWLFLIAFGVSCILWLALFNPAS